MSPTVACFGVCGGKPGWKDPDTGLHCTVCGGSGTFTSHDQRDDDAAAWEKMRSRETAKSKVFKVATGRPVK